ncbi:sulfurtransferase [Massilia litorea]|jgi:thiosulfate/3-mercaptopyruvate sulfurtransferase|uniref:Sulfurtransferase n=1 Tax=Massilia litorea TaxID=2769491 RepID=A0A7L9U6M2_9BURK|nr:sulfurtransferase [Massilia litorea]QOL50079.1 sulfurtransferase [Massilia litorea]
MYTTLISAADLAAHIDDPDWVVVDCRHDLADLAFGRAAYAAGHLPHALFADMETELSGEKRGEDGAFRGRHPLPSKDALVDTLRRWGVNDSTQVVAYDAHGGMYAARLWWLLRWIGHEASAVLDGGLPAWQALGQPLSADPPEPRRSGSIALHAPFVPTVTVAEVLENIETEKRTVVDARAADRFRGENETIDPVGGHIPGAKNRFFKDNLHNDGRFKAPEQLREEFSGVIDDPEKAIMQCGSGVTACHNLLALEVAGMPGAALYPGSWSEWSSDPARPVAKG